MAAASSVAVSQVAVTGVMDLHTATTTTTIRSKFVPLAASVEVTTAIHAGLAVAHLSAGIQMSALSSAGRPTSPYIFAVRVTPATGHSNTAANIKVQINTTMRYSKTVS